MDILGQSFSLLTECCCQFLAFLVIQSRQVGVIEQWLGLENAAVYLGVGIGGLEVTENTMKAYFESNQTRMSPMTIPLY